MKKLYRSILREKFFIVCVCSLTAFWLKAIDYQITLLAFGKLLILYLALVPLLLFVSPGGVDYIRKIIGQRHQIRRISLYVVFVAFVSYQLSRHPSLHISFDTVDIFILTLFTIFVYFCTLIWKPLIFIVISKVLLDLKRPNPSGLTWRIALLFLIFELLVNIGSLIPLLEGYRQRMLINAFWGTTLELPILSAPSIFIKHHYVMFMLERCLPLLPIVLILPQVLCLKDIGIGKPSSGIKKIAIISLLISCYILFLILKAIIIDKSELPSLMGILSVLYYVYILALFEEISFRGVLQNYFSRLLEKRQFGKADANSIAICTASILFSLTHYPFPASKIPYYFLMGVAFGWLFYKSNSIWPPTIAHGTLNLVIKALY